MAAQVAACILPLWVFAGYLSFKSFDNGRQSLEQSLSAAAQSQMRSVEFEMATMEASLRALATSPSLDRHDYAGFYRQAEEVLRHSSGANIVLRAITGEQIINTLRPFGEPLPTDPPPYLSQVIATGQSVLSDLYHGQVSGRPTVSLSVPVVHQGRTDSVLVMALDTKHLTPLIRQDGYPSSWVGAILDGTGTIVARIRDPEKYVGQKAAPNVLEAIRTASRGVAEVTSLEGTVILAGYQRSERYGWTFIVAVPREVLEANLKWSLRASLAGGAGLFLFTLLSAWLLWRSVVSSENARTRIEEAQARLSFSNTELFRLAEVMAHHFQEPARRLVIYSQKLRKTLDGQQSNNDSAQWLAFIDQQARRLHSLVRDIQRYLEANRSKGDIRPVALRQLIESAVAARATDLSSIEADVSVDGDFPVILADHQRLTEVMDILLENSIRYRHPERRLHISISVDAVDGKARVRVADNGPGIDAAYRERVFQIFEQLYPDSADNSTGIGLSLVKRYLTDAKGTVWIEETPGGGATFVLELPVGAS